MLNAQSQISNATCYDPNLPASRGCAVAPASRIFPPWPLPLPPCFRSALPAPDFSLPDVATGRTVSLGDFAGKDALLVIFLCAHCPYVVHVKDELARLGRDYAGRNVGIVGITSNDTVSYPQDAPAPTAAFAARRGSLFRSSSTRPRRWPGLHRGVHAGFFLFGPDQKLIYRGQLDSSRPGQGAPNGAIFGRRSMRSGGRRWIPRSARALGAISNGRRENAPAYFAKG